MYTLLDIHVRLQFYERRQFPARSFSYRVCSVYFVFLNREKKASSETKEKREEKVALGRD